MNVITPTVSRKVWFWPNGQTQLNGALIDNMDPSQPMDATVVCVWGDRCVNLAVRDHGGLTHTPRSVTLRQPGDDVPSGYYCEWMPYQVGQAKAGSDVGKVGTAPAASDTAIEREIQAKGKTAPRITPADIEANIRSEVYFTATGGARSEAAHVKSEYVEGERILAPLDLLTFCVLVLRNGFTVVGESACASPENFDAEIGRKVARANAIAKVWPLMGYELKCRLANTPPDA